MNIRPLVVIPTKDNVATVGQVALDCLQYNPDVLVVNDGSSDGTGQVLADLGSRISVLTHPENKGKGAALTSAFHWAREQGFSHVIAIDADGQHLAEDLPLFLDAARQDPWAIHLGVRDMSTAPGSSQFGRKFSNFWIWVETGHEVGDSQTGYRVYPVEPILSLRLPKGRYEWEVEVLTRALWAGIAVRDIPCQVYYPPPEERVSSFRPFWDNLRISLLNTRLVAGRILWPPRWINRVPAPGQAWQGQHLGRTWGWAFFYWMIRLTGRWPATLMMVVMASFYLLFAGSHRRGVMSYAGRVRPEAGTLGRLWLTWRVFYSFACSLVDRFYVMGRGSDSLRVIREGTEAARDSLFNHGGLVISAHMGNPDLGGAVLGGMSTSKKVHLVQYTSAGDPYLAMLRRYLGPRMPEIISLNSGGEMASLGIARTLRDGQIVAMKGDRLVDERCVRVRFLGGEVELPTGPFLMAALSKAPVVVMGCFREGASYRVLASEPRVYRFTSRKERDDDLQRWAQEFAQVMEDWARRYPTQWYNFHDLWR